MTFSEHPVMSWTSWWSLLSSCILNTAVQGACSLPTPCFLTKVRIRKLKEAPLSACPLSSAKSHVVQMGMRRGCRKPDLTSDCQRSFPTQSLLQLHRPAVNVTSLPTAPTGPTPLPSFWLMLSPCWWWIFCLLCCPSHLSANPRSANTSLLSTISWENFYTRLWVISSSWFTVPKSEICRCLPTCADIQQLLFMERCCLRD